MTPQTKPKRGGRVDDYQQTHVDLFREQGWTVEVLSDAGHGLPDLLVWDGIEFFLVEVKSGNKPPSKRKLTKRQEQFFEKFSQAFGCGRILISIDAEQTVSAIENREF